ncbi:HAD family hydrolase [Cohnella abietis]|uniref:2-haloalkanoic acid dehalogenase n=1 Tax=Cohnella abietis TaxID=2507935 RepID=A0A3T1D0L4_9BACL|nr:HAD family hydrolase [Cohnella abietis]BBI31636.1 2-haloalkanoic acid dehalogenase [Cohnella abietis]
MTIKSYIWFDLGYTLVYKPRETVYQAFLRENGIERSLEEIELAYHLTDKQFMREYPRILGSNDEYYFPWYLGVLNYRMKVSFRLQEQYKRLENIEQNQRYRWQLYPFVIDVLERLKKRGLRIGLISNWDQSARVLLEEHGLTSYFDQLVISSEVGFEKPSALIFQHAFKLAGVTAQQCIYVGDNYYDDVVGCSQIGLDTVLINRFGKSGLEEIDHTPILDSIASLPEWLNKNNLTGAHHYGN